VISLLTSLGIGYLIFSTLLDSSIDSVTEYLTNLNINSLLPLNQDISTLNYSNCLPLFVVV